MDKIDRTVLNFLSFLSIGSAIFLGLVVIYWLVFPYEILTFGEGNGKILNPEKKVESGQYLMTNQVACKKKKLPAIISRQLIDSIVYQIPIAIIDRPVGCSETIEYIYLSKGIPPGNYYLNTTITYEVNPIRKITYTIKTETFEIVK